MKSIAFYLIAIVLTVLAGYFVGEFAQRFESENVNENFYQNQWPDAKQGSKNWHIGRVIGPSKHDFGKIESEQYYSHDFIIENRGTRDLEIWISEPVAAPVLVQFGSEKLVLKPKTSAPIEVSVNGSDVTESFEIPIVVQTNMTGDDSTITLVVSGTK